MRKFHRRNEHRPIGYFVSDWKNNIEENVEIIDIFQPDLELILREESERCFESIEYFIQRDIHVESPSFSFAHMIEIRFSQIWPKVPVFEPMRGNVQHSRRTKRSSCSSIEKILPLTDWYRKRRIASLDHDEHPNRESTLFNDRFDVDLFGPLG